MMGLPFKLPALLLFTWQAAALHNPSEAEGNTPASFQSLAGCKSGSFSAKGPRKCTGIQHVECGPHGGCTGTLMGKPYSFNCNHKHECVSHSWDGALVRKYLSTTNHDGTMHWNNACSWVCENEASTLTQGSVTQPPKCESEGTQAPVNGAFSGYKVGDQIEAAAILKSSNTPWSPNSPLVGVVSKVNGTNIQRATLTSRSGSFTIQADPWAVVPHVQKPQGWQLSQLTKVCLLLPRQEKQAGAGTGKGTGTPGGNPTGPLTFMEKGSIVCSKFTTEKDIQKCCRVACRELANEQFGDTYNIKPSELDKCQKGAAAPPGGASTETGAGAGTGTPAGDDDDIDIDIGCFDPAKWGSDDC